MAIGNALNRHDPRPETGTVKPIGGSGVCSRSAFFDITNTEYLASWFHNLFWYWKQPIIDLNTVLSAELWSVFQIGIPYVTNNLQLVFIASSEIDNNLKIDPETTLLIWQYFKTHAGFWCTVKFRPLLTIMDIPLAFPGTTVLVCLLALSRQVWIHLQQC